MLAQAERVIYIYTTNAPINQCLLYAYFFSDNSMHSNCFPMFSSSLYVLY